MQSVSEQKLIERVEKLEERTAYQDKTIEELSDAVTDQWKLIESLKRDTKRLGDELKEVEENLTRGEGREPPPPHY